MTGILKDFPFAMAYLDDIIIFSKTPQEHLSHICMIFKKLKSINLSMKKSKCSFFSKEIQYLGHILSVTGIWQLPAKTHTIQHMRPPTTPKQVRAFLGLVGYYRKFIKGFAKTSKPLTLLTRQQVKFDWTPEHHATFLHLKWAIVQAPILHYPNTNKKYIVYTDASNDACGAQLTQEYNGTEFPVAFLSHTFMETNGNGAPQNKKLLAHTMPSPNGITTYKVLTSLSEMTINFIGGAWNLQPTSPLSGFLEPGIKQQLASPD